MMKQFIGFLLLISLSECSLGTSPSPPSFSRQPTSGFLLFQVAIEPDQKDKPFTLDCEAEGDPKPTYTWTKNGKLFQWRDYSSRISQKDGSGTLTILSPKEVDDGYYQCTATNEYGSAMSNVVLVRKLELNAFPHESPRKKVVKEGEPMTLSCTPPAGFPKPNVFWIIFTNTGTLLSISNPRITVDPNGNLHFSNVTRNDSVADGFYACSTSIIYKNDFKIGTKFDLEVVPSTNSPKGLAPTEQYVSPSNVTAAKGESLRIHCIFGGTPLPDVKWQMNGKNIPDGRVRYTNYGKTIFIRRIDFDDGGKYECTATNKLGSVSRTINVFVQAAPRWISVSNDVNAEVGDDVDFECKASGVPKPEIKWLMNGAPLNVTDNLIAEISSTSLRMKNVRKQHTAVYQCNASNPLGYVFKNFYINVLVNIPEITIQPKELYEVLEGHTVRLTCEAYGIPRPEISWTRNGEDVNGNRFTKFNSGDLEIREVTFLDEGRYRCIAVNKYNATKSRNGTGFLKVFGKTKILKGPDNNEIDEGQSAEFRCISKVDDRLKLTLEWQHDGQIIDFHKNRRMSRNNDTLFIVDVQESDAGNYSCIATTRLDRDTAEATLVVRHIYTTEFSGDHELNENVTEFYTELERNATVILSFTENDWNDTITLMSIRHDDNRTESIFGYEQNITTQLTSGDGEPNVSEVFLDQEINATVVQTAIPYTHGEDLMESTIGLEENVIIAKVTETKEATTTIQSVVKDMQGTNVTQSTIEDEQTSIQMTQFSIITDRSDSTQHTVDRKQSSQILLVPEMIVTESTVDVDTSDRVTLPSFASEKTHTKITQGIVDKKLHVVESFPATEENIYTTQSSIMSKQTLNVSHSTTEEDNK